MRCAAGFCTTCGALLVAVPRVLQQLRTPAVTFSGKASADRYIGTLLSSVPERVLTAAEREALESDGLVVVHQLVADEAVLDLVADAAVSSSSSFSDNLPHPVMFNGAIRSLLRHGPFGSLAASALGADAVRVSDSDIWVKEAVETPAPSGPWHKDLHNRASASQPYITVWLALTDAPHAVEWLLKSHRLPHNCSYGDNMLHLSLGVDQDCMTGLWRRSLAGGAGLPVGRTYALRKGDAVLFHGGLWHRGRSGSRLRIAVDFRFVPANMQFAGAISVDGLYRSMYHGYVPEWCDTVGGPLFPVVHPRANATFDHELWPVVLTLLDVIVGQLELGDHAIRWARAGYKLPECVNGRLVFSNEL